MIAEQEQLQMPVLKRPPLRYHGGKWRLGPWIIQFIPEHHTYVEIFGGAAGVLLRKPRSRIEIYNDLDGQVVSFFSTIRQPDLLRKIVERLELTLFARAEFELAYIASDDPVEAASRFVVRLFMGFGTSSIDPLDSNGFRSCDRTGRKNYARDWAGVPSAISAAADRFRGVIIERLDFRKIIPKFDGPETVFYADPPYPMSTQSAGGKGYVHELTDQEHRWLSWLLHGVRGKVLLSGYRCSLYDDLYADFRRVEKNTSANGQRGAVPRTEFLYMNF